MNYASVAVLSYKRIDYLRRMMASLIHTDAGYPMEIIVHDDGSDRMVTNYLYELLAKKKISYLILNGGKNRGIGEAIRNCFKVASGKYLFKVDTDLTFEDSWLKKGVEILQDKEVGVVSLFNYNHYDPDDDRFKVEKTKENHLVVSDFVSSIYGVRRDVYELYKNKLSTDGWHQFIKEQGYDLAISDKDLVQNFGFGANKSIYLDKNDKGEIITRETHKLPLIFS